MNTNTTQDDQTNFSDMTEKEIKENLKISER